MSVSLEILKGMKLSLQCEGLQRWNLQEVLGRRRGFWQDRALVLGGREETPEFSFPQGHTDRKATWAHSEKAARKRALIRILSYEYPHLGL